MSVRNSTAIILSLFLSACAPKGVSSSGDSTGASIEIDNSGANPVFSWQLPGTGPNDQKATSIGIVGGASNCSGLKDANWSLQAKDQVGFDGPVMYGTVPDGSEVVHAATDLTFNITKDGAKDTEQSCSFIVQVGYMRDFKLKFVQKQFGLRTATDIAHATEQATAAGLLKPRIDNSRVQASVTEEVTAVAGTYVVESVNGSPMPFKYPNGWATSGGELVMTADGKYSAKSVLTDPKGKSMTMDLAGSFLIAKSKISLKATVGPEFPGTTRHEGDTVINTVEDPVTKKITTTIFRRRA